MLQTKAFCFSRGGLVRVLLPPSCLARVWMGRIQVECNAVQLAALKHTGGRHVLRSRVACTTSEEQEEAGHVPVLLKEVLQQFSEQQIHSFVDCTLGAGGHAAAIIRAHPELQTFIGLDVDPVAHAEAKVRLEGGSAEMQDFRKITSSLKLHLIRSNFRNMKAVLGQVNEQLVVDGVDGVLLDLGMSSMQVNSAERGFSFLRDGPADMRMDPAGSLKAEEILNKWPEAEIGRILREYGEERRWRYLARKIVEARLAGGISTTSHLAELVGPQKRFKPGPHPATRTFQALRIAVNDELNSLKAALSDAFASLSSGGRLAVISFHSLEDRIVKHFFLEAAGVRPQPECLEEDLSLHVHIPGQTRHGFQSGRERLMQGSKGLEKSKQVLVGKKAIILTRRPIVAGEQEVQSNPRSRSAKLRVIQRL